jgi:hypothetical protein
LSFSERFPKRLYVRHWFAVDFCNDILALNILLRGQAVVRYVGHDDSLLNPEMKALGNFLG